MATASLPQVRSRLVSVWPVP